MLKKVQDGVDAIKRDVTDSGLHRSPSWWHIIIVRIFIIIAVITIITAITRYDLGRLITSLSSPTAITASSAAQSCPQVQPIKQINRRNNQTNRTINKQTKRTNSVQQKVKGDWKATKARLVQLTFKFSNWSDFSASDKFGASLSADVDLRGETSNKNWQIQKIEKLTSGHSRSCKAYLSL